LLVVASGCILTSEVDTSAKDLRDEADDEARDWNADASLVSVFGAEIDQALIAGVESEADVPELDGALPAIGDEAPGDGQLPAWGFRYEAGGEAYTFALAANRSLVTSGVANAAGTGTPIGDWQITAGDATDIVRENNATWARASNAPIVWYHLARENPETDPIWSVGFAGPESGERMFHVNATTGEYLGAGPLGDLFPRASQPASRAPVVPPREGAAVEDSVDATEPTRTHTLAVERSNHPSLHTRIELDDPATSAVNVTVEGPHEQQATMEIATTETTGSLAIPEPAAGDWAATVTLKQGAAQAYELAWCAEGDADRAGENANKACKQAHG
jgi:hypothetical protein